MCMDKIIPESLLNSAPFPIFSFDREYRYTFFNRTHAIAMHSLYGTDIQLGGKLSDYQTVVEDWKIAKKNLDRVLNGETVIDSAHVGDLAFTQRMVEVSHSPIFSKDGEVIGVSVFAFDNTEQKRLLMQQNLTIKILGILNKQSNFINLIDEIIKSIKTATGLEAVGIRLKDGEDFPYISHQGFSKDFITAENSVLIRDGKGSFCRNEDGTYCLECTCGMILSGKKVQNIIPLTAKGSVWTNDSSELLKIPGSIDPRMNPRNRCIHEGFQSVALIPIKLNSENIGILQFNDKRRNFFIPEMIEFFEGISVSIGVALQRNLTEDSLKKSKENFKTMIDQAPLGIALIDALTGQLLEANPRFLEISGRSFEEMKNIDWMSITYSEDVSFDSENLLMLKDKKINCYQGEKRIILPNGSILWIDQTTAYFDGDLKNNTRLICMVQDISDRKNTEELRHKYLSAVIEAQENECHRIAKELHDGVIQLLGATLHRLRSPASATLSITAEDLLVRAINETRRITYSLRPTILDDLGLVAAIQSFCAEFDERSKKKTKLNFNEFLKPFDPKVELAVYRIVVEALSNIEKHSQASQVFIDLQAHSSDILLKISDSGKGFNYEKISKANNGLGLLHMKERAFGVGGSALIESNVGQGTVITVKVPMVMASEVKI